MFVDITSKDIINSDPLSRGCNPEQIKRNQQQLDLFSIPLIAQFRLLTFYGLADGTLLTKGFPNQDVQNRLMIVKSFRVIPYYNIDSVDLFVNDGVTTNKETIPAGTRIDRLFDTYAGYSSIRLFINGSLTGIFSELGGAGRYPLDIWEDNIYYKYPAKITGVDVSINGEIVDNIENDTRSNPLVKVLLGVYLYNEQD